MDATVPVTITPPLKPDMVINEFTAAQKEGGETTTISPEDTVAQGIDGAPDSVAIEITAKCSDCGSHYLLNGGDLRHVASDERQMGAERQYAITLHNFCDTCEQDLMADLICWEYPKGQIRAGEIEPQSEVEYVSPGDSPHNLGS